MQATEFKKVLGNDITDLESAISDLGGYFLDACFVGVSAECAL